MFKHLNNERYLCNIKKYIYYEDREEYLEYIVNALSFCNTNNLVVDGLNSVVYGNSTILDIEEFELVIYTTSDLIKTTKELANYLYENSTAKTFDKNYVVVNFLIPYREHHVFVNTRRLFKVIYYNKQFGNDVLSSIGIHAQIFDIDTMIIPPEFKLIQMVHTLYRFESIDNWKGLLAQINNIYNRIVYINFNKQADQLIIGGDDKGINKTLISKLDYIIVGDYALGSAGRLQFISADKPNEIIDKLSSMGMSAKYKQNTVFIPGDIQLKKYIFTINDGFSFDVYNSTSYELVPYRMKSGKKIASMIVILRFKLIDLWVLKLMNMGNFNVSKETFDRYIKQIKGIIEYIHLKFYTIEPVEGIYVSEVTKRNEILRNVYRIPKYYPYLSQAKK